MITFPELNKFLVKEESSIHDAIKVVDLNGKGVCLVIKKNKQLLGILTDGDIRRILLKGGKLSDKVKSKVNKKFFFIKKKKLFKVSLENIKKKFFHIPVLNKNKIHSLLLKEDLEIKRKENFVFILAGGLGKRMKNLTKKIPKPMLKINKKPILENQINFFKNKGFYNFIISVNYLSNKIINYFGDGKKFGVNIEYSKEKFFLGTAGPLSLLKNKRILNNIIIINGDIYADIDFGKILNYHEKNNNDLTLSATRQQYKFPFGIINQNTKTLDFINEKPELNFLVNSGIYIIKPKILKLLKFNKYLDMNNFINFLKRNKKKIEIYLIYERIFDIGNKSQYNKVKDIFNN
jgi:dTDP-glucose pyrophosphorylase/CBS domain-containing protein